MKRLKWILTFLSFAVIALVAVNATFANDAQGDIKISSYELQRIEINDNNTENNNLEPYREGIMLVPTVAEEIIMADNEQQWSKYASDLLFSETVSNAVDQFVFAKNEGSSSAFVRIWFAFEQGGIKNDSFDDVIAINKNKSVWSWDETKTQYGVEILGNKYVVMCAVYNKTVEGNSITSNPSLLQVVMKHGVSSKTADLLDGNSNYTYDILITAQAVQFVENVNIADILNSVYGLNHPWSDITEIPSNNEGN